MNYKECSEYNEGDTVLLVLKLEYVQCFFVTGKADCCHFSAVRLSGLEIPNQSRSADIAPSTRVIGMFALSL